MDHRAGVWPVEEGGGSSSSGPAVPEDVEEGEPVEKLVAQTAPTATDREEHTALVSRVLHRTWPNASASYRWKRNHYSSDCH